MSSIKSDVFKLKNRQSAQEVKQVKKKPLILTISLVSLCMIIFAVSALACTITPGQNGGDASLADDAITVSFSVVCYDAVEGGSQTALAVSDKGAMVDTTLQLNPGATVYDALVASEVVLGSRSSSMGMYVYSINGLTEKEIGPQSGWKFYVNDVAGSTSCNLQELKDGDAVEWRYEEQA